MRFTILFFLFTSVSVFTKPGISDSLLNAGIRQIYDLQFKNAENTFKGIIKSHPESPVGYFFDAMIVWWKIAVDMDNEKYDDLFYDKLDKTIDICEEALDKNSEDTEAMFFKGGALGFEGRLKSIREEWFDAALDGKDALPLVYKVAELDTSNIDVQLGFGIYNYYAAAVPEKYPFVKPFMVFFPGGDKKKGIEQLKYVAKNGKYARYEALYFLLSINYNFEENNLQTLKYATELFAEFPDNAIFERYIGRVYFRMSRFPQSTETFEDVYRKCKSGKTGYNENAQRESSYYIGLDLMKKNKNEESVKYFEESRKISMKIDIDEESGFRINTSLYLGRLYLRLKQYEKSEKYLEEVLDLRDFRNSHNNAENDLKQLKRTVKKQ